MKPFLLLSHRREDAAADEEYEAMLRFTGLDEPSLVRIRLEQPGHRVVTPTRYAGIILGGGPFNVSDPDAGKSDVQRRVEAELDAVVDEVLANELPFLGACYGTGVLGRHQGGRVGTAFGEPVGATTVQLTDDGAEDQLFSALPPTFEAYVGHKESLERPPANAVVLATSAACPVQAFRIGLRAYATQFHPELDRQGLCSRIDVYRYAGYFRPEMAEELKQRAREVEVVHPPTLLERFVELFSA